mmetsp:Transcript_11135/g.21156  ORF Transcript_11135/g.21156 Transcript_11135/m.21156 type:complete len:355 (-) Transcript_11135:1098-2162(-)
MSLVMRVHSKSPVNLSVGTLHRPWRTWVRPETWSCCSAEARRYLNTWVGSVRSVSFHLMASWSVAISWSNRSHCTSRRSHPYASKNVPRLESMKSLSLSMACTSPRSRNRLRRSTLSSRVSSALIMTLIHSRAFSVTSCRLPDAVRSCFTSSTVSGFLAAAAGDLALLSSTTSCRAEGRCLAVGVVGGAMGIHMPPGDLGVMGWGDSSAFSSSSRSSISSCTPIPSCRRRISTSSFKPPPDRGKMCSDKADRISVCPWSEIQQIVDSSSRLIDLHWSVLRASACARSSIELGVIRKQFKPKKLLHRARTHMRARTCTFSFLCVNRLRRPRMPLERTSRLTDSPVSSGLSGSSFR